MKKQAAAIFTIMLVLLSIPSCKNSTSPDDPDLLPKTYKNSAWTTATGEFDILGAYKDGSMVAIDSIPDANSNTRVLYKSSNSDPGLLLWLGPDGTPSLGNIDGNIFVFENYSGSTVDIGIIWKDGNIEMLRGVEFSNSNASRVSKLGAGQIGLGAANLGVSWSNIFNVVGHGLSVGSCAISVAVTLASGGLGWPLTVVGCGAAIVGLLIEAEVIDNPGIESSSTAIGTFASALGCISGGNCWSFLANAAGAVVSSAEGDRATNSNAIETTRAALRQQGGDVQVTLTWNNTSDIDLWVTDPDGEQIYYAHPYSASGGALDVDDTNGYGPENIYWPGGAAPTGVYYVDVDYYSGSGTAGYSVLIQAFGRVRRFEGNISPYETIRICSFSDQALTGIQGQIITHIPKPPKGPSK